MPHRRPYPLSDPQFLNPCTDKGRRAFSCPHFVRSCRPHPFSRRILSVCASKKLGIPQARTDSSPILLNRNTLWVNSLASPLCESPNWGYLRPRNTSDHVGWGPERRSAKNFFCHLPTAHIHRGKSKLGITEFRTWRRRSRATLCGRPLPPRPDSANGAQSRCGPRDGPARKCRRCRWCSAAPPARRT